MSKERFQTMELMDCIGAALAALESGKSMDQAYRAGARLLTRFRQDVRPSMAVRYYDAFEALRVES